MESTLTLKNLVDNLNESLQDMYGTRVSNVQDVCKNVRAIIKENEFYKSLSENGLENLLVFKDDIDNMRNIFLRGSDSNEDNLKKIIQINLSIAFFDESNYSAGGTLNSVKCELVDIGIKIQNMSLDSVVIGLKMSDIKNKKDELEQEMKSLEEEIANLKNMLEEKRHQFNTFGIQMSELQAKLKLKK